MMIGNGDCDKRRAVLGSAHPDAPTIGLGDLDDRGQLLSFANLALAAIAYRRRAKQLRGNSLREQQLELAAINNRLARRRLDHLEEQLDLLSEIRQAVCVVQERPTVGVIDIGSATVRLAIARYDPEAGSLLRLSKQGRYLGPGRGGRAPTRLQ
jgi:hypothetical protein